jgi:hypothetical protein
VRVDAKPNSEDGTPRRPTRPTTPGSSQLTPGPYVEKKRGRAKAEAFDDPNRDYFAEAAALRRELEDGGPPMPEPHMEWLERLDQLNRELNANVVQSACIDNSPTLIFDRAANSVISEMNDSDSLGVTAKKMIDEGFDAIHEMLAREGELVQERIRILHEMQASLIEHKCDYTADLELDDDEADAEVPVYRARPQTAPRFK